MTNQTKRKSFIIHKDSLDILDQLNDEQAGKLFKAIFQYQKTGDFNEFDQFTKIILTPFISQFKRDEEKWSNVVERNKANISKRWNKNNTTGKTGIPNNTKNTDSDSKSDSDSKNEKNIIIKEYNTSSEISSDDFQNENFFPAEKDKNLINLREERKKKSSAKRKKKEFVPPTFEEVQAYCIERKNSINAKYFFDLYSVADWKDIKGNQIQNWKQKIITWESKQAKTEQKTNSSNQFDANQWKKY